MAERLPTIEVPPGVTVDKATAVLRRLSLTHFGDSYKEQFFATRALAVSVQSESFPGLSARDARAARVAKLRELMGQCELEILAVDELNVIEDRFADRAAPVEPAA